MAKKFEEVGADIIELNMALTSYNLELTSGSNSASTKNGSKPRPAGDAVAEIVRK